jgi:integrase
MKRSGLPKYVTEFRDRHGKLRLRARRRGDTHYFVASKGTEEFFLEYQRWLAGASPVQEEGLRRAALGSVSSLITSFYRSIEWSQLAPTTQSTYRGILEKFREQHGEKRWSKLEHHHVRNIIRQKIDTPAAANNLRRMLRILAKFAIEENWTEVDPTARVKGIKRKTDGFHSWSDEEIEAFARRWPIKSREHLAFALLLYTGQRRSNVVRMGRQHLRGRRIFVKQQKTGAELLIPIHSRLSVVLSAHEAQHMTYLTTAYGAPMSPAGFGNWFREACNAAGLKKCSAHGLRKAATRRLIEAGVSTKAAAAITGHKTLKQLEVYMSGANQVTLADNAIDQLERTEGERDLANLETGLAKSSSNSLKKGE